ncbi:MAG TPA: TIGR02466 family protein [Tepidisphaeraceae bacterium]|jgi:uncharacterized protein (TIGR02466 family)
MELSANFLWNTPLIEARFPDHARIKPTLIQHCYEIERQAKQPIESGVTPRRKANLYESRFNFFSHPLPEIQALRDFCAQALGQSVMKLIQQASKGAPVPNLAVDLFESWIHITHEGGYHEVHNHPNCSWCGIYYLEPADCTVDPPNGINRFFSPIDIMYDDPGTEAYPQKPISVTPEEGKLLLFPAYVKHLAVPYKGTRDRIIVSFNSRVMIPNANGR